MRDLDPRWSDTDETFRLATVVTSFAELLRDSPHAADVSYAEIFAEAEALSNDMRGDEIETLVDLIATAETLS